MHIPQTEVILRHDGTELARATLPPGEYVIGRERESDIHADTPLLSRQHARLTINYDHLLIEDLGSSNGTFVNERRIAEVARLFPNQPIRLGDVTLEVRRQRASTEPDVSLPPAQAAIKRHLPDELLGEKRYAIGGIVARGGMGAILDARQRATKRTVAMKVMLETGDAADVLRFIEEAQVTAQLDHPNIVPVYELGVDEQDQLFYTMKMVRGITLKKVLELLAQGVPETVTKYPLPVLLTIFQKVCDAIAFAHSKGVIHRDLKPENLMLGDFGSVLVMDWGLAKIIGQNDAPGRDARRSGLVTVRGAEPELSATMTGSILGTPAYMSPEQARGEIETLDARSDIYALGTILFEILHLRAAVSGTDAMEIVGKVARGEVAWNARKSAGLPDSLLAICHQALALEKAQRYPSTEALQADLLAYQNGFATSAESAGLGRQLLLALKRNKIAAAGIAAVLVVGTTFGTKALIEGRRAEREAVRATNEAVRANNALADLKKTAPALFQLARAEAKEMRFDRASKALEAGLVLDPDHKPALWERAWIFLAQERYADAASALRTARDHDPQTIRGAILLPVVEQLAEAGSDAERFTPGRIDALRYYLLQLDVGYVIRALNAKLQFSDKEKLALVRDALESPKAYGKDNVSVTKRSDGSIAVDLTPNPQNSTMEPLCRLPINHLKLNGTRISDLRPLHGLPLLTLDISYKKISDLDPLAGIALVELNCDHCEGVTNVTALKDAPLRKLNLALTKITNCEVLRGMPLEELSISATLVSDLKPLAGLRIQRMEIDRTTVRVLTPLVDMPITFLALYETPVDDISPLRGKPIEELIMWDTKVRDLSPLHDMPLVTLYLQGIPKDADVAPLLTLPKLQQLVISASQKNLPLLRKHPTLQQIIISPGGYPGGGFRPVKEVLDEYDAQQAAGKK